MVLHNPKPLPGLEVPTLPARTTQIHFVEKPVNAIKTWMICYNSCVGVCFISKRSFLGLEVPYLPARTIKPHFVAKLVICWHSGVDIDVDVITQWQLSGLGGTNSCCMIPIFTMHSLFRYVQCRRGRPSLHVLARQIALPRTASARWQQPDTILCRRSVMQLDCQASVITR